MALGSKGDRGGGGRGRPYGVMLLLAFGAAVLGVLVLHKLRERRICTLLIKDKDHDLMDLHFLLQKERESAKEMKIKIEELKAKAYSLRTQKMELSNKVAAIQSITSSLKEEHRALESTLQEHQNEINMLRQKEIESSKENSQAAALRELLKQKEAEIEEMKHLAETPTKIWSVSTDDPSNPPVPVVLEKTENDGMDLVKEQGGESKNVTEGTEKKEINAGEMEKLKGRGENLVGRSKAGDNNTEETQRKEEVSRDENSETTGGTRSFRVGGDKDNRDKAEVAGIRDEASKEHPVELNNPEGRLRGNMSNEGMKLKNLGRSRMVVGSKVKGGNGRRSTRRTTTRRKIIARETGNPENRVVHDVQPNNADIPEQERRRADDSGSVEDHENGLRREGRSGDRNSFKVDKQSEVSGERKFRIFENSKDEGLRINTEKNGEVELDGADGHGGVSNERNAISSRANDRGAAAAAHEMENKLDVIREQGADGDDNSKIAHVAREVEKAGDDMTSDLNWWHLKKPRGGSQRGPNTEGAQTT